MSDEIGRILADAETAAPEVDETARRRIVRAVLKTLDALIDENLDRNENSTWPDADDLGLLAADIHT